MMSALRAALLATLFALLTGCAGSNFVRPASDAFKLGQTTYPQVVKKMDDEPRKTGEVLKNDKKIRTATYVYASIGGEALESGVIPARGLSFYFEGDILVGQEFVSSFKEDNSNFDDTKIPSIIKGKTTRAEVIALLGKPSATYIPPMVKDTSGEAFGYGYQTTSGSAFTGFKFFNKNLKVTFDDKDVVLDVDYTSSGNK